MLCNAGSRLRCKNLGMGFDIDECEVRRGVMGCLLPVVMDGKRYGLEWE